MPSRHSLTRPGRFQDLALIAARKESFPCPILAYSTILRTWRTGKNDRMLASLVWIVYLGWIVEALPLFLSSQDAYAGPDSLSRSLYSFLRTPKSLPYNTPRPTSQSTRFNLDGC
jgi:hypothetical protein